MDEAVRELQVKQYELSKTFVSLKKLGLEGDCKMPQLLTIGMQSSGEELCLGENFSRPSLNGQRAFRDRDYAAPTTRT